MTVHNPPRPRVAIFSPNPMISIAIESFSAEGGDDIHIFDYLRPGPPPVAMIDGAAG